MFPGFIMVILGSAHGGFTCRLTLFPSYARQGKAALVQAAVTEMEQGTAPARRLRMGTTQRAKAPFSALIDPDKGPSSSATGTALGVRPPIAPPAVSFSRLHRCRLSRLLCHELFWSLSGLVSGGGCDGHAAPPCRLWRPPVEQTMCTRISSMPFGAAAAAAATLLLLERQLRPALTSAHAHNTEGLRARMPALRCNKDI